jgi:hypothetical protein
MRRMKVQSENNAARIKKQTSLYGLTTSCVQSLLRPKLVERLYGRFVELKESGREAFALNFLAEENNLGIGYGVGLREVNPYTGAIMVVNAAFSREINAEGEYDFDNDPKHVVLGFWKDPKDGRPYVDFGCVLSSLKAAVMLGRRYGQKAIYSFEHDMDIRLDEDLGEHCGCPLVRCPICKAAAICPECFPTGACTVCYSPQEVHKHTPHIFGDGDDHTNDISRLEDEGGIVLDDKD